MSGGPQLLRVGDRGAGTVLVPGTGTVGLWEEKDLYSIRYPYRLSTRISDFLVPLVESQPAGVSGLERFENDTILDTFGPSH